MNSSPNCNYVPPDSLDNHYNSARRRKHRRALNNPEVVRSLSMLRENWQTLETLQRALQIEHLIAAGCTLRGLAAVLVCSEASLRWYMKISRASEVDKTKISSGESAKKILASSKAKKIAEARTEQLLQNGVIDSISTQLKELAVRWIGEQEMHASYIELLLSTVDRRLWNLPNDGETFRHGNTDDLWQSIQSNKPKVEKPTYGPDLLEYLSDWMVAWIPLLVPERAMREAMLLELGHHYAQN